MADTGFLSRIFHIFGYYQASPINMTQQEVKDRTKGLQHIENRNNQELNETRFYTASSDPVKRMADMADMAESDLVGPILDVYSEEACQPDINRGTTLWYECNDSEVEKDLNEMLERINTEDILPTVVTGVSGKGNDFRRILYNDKGIQQLVGIPVQQMKRIWDPTTRRLIGFRWKDQKPREEDILYNDDKTIFAPWHFLHFRRLTRSDTEYGTATLDKLYTLWRKLERSIDQMVVYRSSTMPNRWAMFVDTGDQDIVDAMESLQIFSTMLRQKSMVTERGMEQRFDAPALDSMIFIPVRTSETNTKLELMQGDKDVPDIPDIEQLMKQLYGGARVPKAYLGQDDDSNGLGNSGSSLVSQDIRFARVIRNLRRAIISGFFRLAQIHLAIIGKDPSKYQVKVCMSRISSIEEEVNIAILEKQANIATSITALLQTLEVPNREIMDLVLREYLSVPRYFLDVAKLATSVAKALGQGSGDADGGGGGGMGGGLGGLGGGMDDLDMGEDEGAAPPPGSGGEDELDAKALPKPAMESAQHYRTLVESRRRKPRQTSEKTWSKIDCLLREVAAGTPRTHVNRKLIEGWSTEIRNLLLGHQAVLSSRRSSLVEDYTGRAEPTETFPTGDNHAKGGRITLTESQILGERSLTEALKEYNEMVIASEKEDHQESSALHEAVNMRQRMRRKI